METKYQVVPIFPTPLYINDIPEQLVLDHIPLLDNEKMVGKEGGTITEQFGSLSENTYILNQPDYQNLSNYILQHATHYAEKYMGYNYVNYKFSQSWVSIKFPGEEHIPHHHPYSLISGVLFYNKPINNTPHISFIRSDEYGKNKNHHKIHHNKLNEFSVVRYNINYGFNRLILFPSYLLHSVNKNLTKTPRKSLAFNIVPKDGFGFTRGLCELKFNN